MIEYDDQDSYDVRHCTCPLNAHGSMPQNAQNILVSDMCACKHQAVIENQNHESQNHEVNVTAKAEVKGTLGG